MWHLPPPNCTDGELYTQGRGKQASKAFKLFNPPQTETHMAL